MRHKESLASLLGTLNCHTTQSFHFAAVNYTEDGTTCQSMTIRYVRLQTHPVQLNAALLEIKQLMICTHLFRLLGSACEENQSFKPPEVRVDNSHKPNAPCLFRFGRRVFHSGYGGHRSL